jgi:hypothetical protein
MLVSAIDATGAVVAGMDRVTGYTGLAAGVYYFILNRPTTNNRDVCAFAIQALAPTVVTSITLEDCLFNDVPIQDELGSWVPETPSSAYVPCTGGFVSSGGVTSGNGPGACVYNVSGLGSSHQRLRVVLSVGGPLRVGDWNES